MRNETYKTEVDPLTLGLTKTALFMGINIKLFFSNIMLGTLLCLDFHTLWGIPLMIMGYLFMLKFSVKDPSFAWVWSKSLTRTPPVMNSSFWGKTNSYEAW